MSSNKVATQPCTACNFKIKGVKSIYTKIFFGIAAGLESIPAN